MAVIIRQIAHDPNARMVHLDDGGDPFGRAQPKPWDARRLGKHVSIQGNDHEAVSGQGEAADFGRASIQHVE